MTDASTDLTEQVLASFAGTPDDRLRAILDSVIRHLHEAVREVEPTNAEWERAIDFLTRTGQKCTDVRQEFILLSDVLGVSMLLETINGQASPDATESTVLGPFHLVRSPPLPNGAQIDLVGRPERCVVTGRVLSTTGTPLGGATVDVWQADDNGFYDVQQPDVQPAGNGRGLLTTDADGTFWFRTVMPRYYPIPVDGPVGGLLTATRRHPYRPAHIHFIATASGHKPLTTHIFVADSEYLDSDAVFAVKDSLVRPFDVVTDADQAARWSTTAPLRHASVELVLQPM
ncbi:MAG TPA: dioxygenase [Jatrophihabitans sp.]